VFRRAEEPIRSVALISCGDVCESTAHSRTLKKRRGKGNVGVLSQGLSDVKGSDGNSAGATASHSMGFSKL
jgi:hypothetical protein